MKTKTIVQLAAALLLSTLNPQLSTVFAQGSLTPPGAPAATMKSLAQIEARTPISSAPFTISVSGSYYLTTNLTVSSGNAITIATNGVTLDLNGFTIASTAPSATGYAILLNSGLSDLTIVNGHIRSGVTNNGGVYSGSGFQSGIYYSGTAPGNTRVTGVSVAGCLARGIYLGVAYSTVVESCTVRTVGSSGIVAATIKTSLAVDCGEDGVSGDQVSDSRGESTGSGYGLSASSTAHNCYGSSSGFNSGIHATTAQNCHGESNGGTGIFANYTAQNCFGSSVTGSGLYAYTAQNCSGVSSSGIGLFASKSALNCYGTSSSGTGLNAYMANSCFGFSTSGTGLTATYGNFCFGSSVSVTTKYNMPP